MEPPPPLNMHHPLQQQQQQQQQYFNHLQTDMSHNNNNYQNSLKPDLYLMGSEEYNLSPSVSPSSKSSLPSPTIPGRTIVPDLSDEELAQLSVRQLNMKLQGHDRNTVSALKQKRRTLKNRGYALNCRIRRIQNFNQLEADNIMLHNKVQYLTEAIQQLQARLQYYEPQTFSSLPPLTPATPTTTTMNVESPNSNHSSSSPPSSNSYSSYNNIPQRFQ
jgi:transcription factor MAFF/G/K